MEFIDVSNVACGVHAMNVCHLTYDMRIGGTERVIQNIITHKDDTNANIDFSILCLMPKLGPIGQQLRLGGVPVTQLDWENGFSLSIIRAIKKHCVTHNIDILHCHQYTPWSYGALACIGLKTKVIFTEHGRFFPDVSSAKRRIINPFLVSCTSAITSISESTRIALNQFEFIPLRKIVTIYNGDEMKLPYSDVEIQQQRQKLQCDDDTVMLGTVARLDPIKNHELMIKATAELSKTTSVKLIIVGDGEQRSALEKLIQSLNLENHVIITGYKEQPQILLSSFDIFLLTSFSEGTSITLLEAMQYKKPCIVSRVGGNPEIINKECGSIIESNNCDELVTAIQQYIDDKNLRYAHGQSAHERFSQHFTVASMFNQYAKLYHDIGGSQ